MPGRQLAEPRREGDLVVVGEVLPPEEHHLVVDQGLLDAAHARVVEVGQVDVVHDRAEART